MKKVIQNKLNLVIGILGVFMCLLPGMLRAQALSGTYIIGTGGDYTTIGDAVSALSTNGITGPVTFNIKAGTYNEQFTLEAITGSSTTNTVTFQSQGGVTGDVQIYHTAAGTSDNYVIKINGASNLSFKNLTISATGTSYGKVIDITSQGSNISILNDSLTSAAGSSSTNNTLIMANGVKLSDIAINNNSFSGGSYGIRLTGVNNNVSSNFNITNNHFSNLNTGIYVMYDNALTVANNITNVSGGTGIYLSQIGGTIQVTKNRMTLNRANGLSLSYISGGNPPTGVHSVIANNMIYSYVTSNNYGIYVTSGTYLDIVFNTISLSGSATSSKAFYASSGSNYLVENNIFSNDAGGYAYYANTPGAISVSDFNNLYSTGNYLAYWNNNLRNLAALQTASSKEVHSVSVYSQFVSNEDLHVTSPWIDGKGVDYANVSTDIDGENRSSQTPDIGADEFTPAAGTTVPLSGNYTVGSGGTYSTITDAVNDLMLKGVSGPVTFNIKSATHLEHISMRAIPGTSDADTVTFQSESGVASDAVIFNNAQTSNDNYVWRLIAANHIRFRNLTLQSDNTSGAQYGRILVMSGACGDVSVRDVVLVGSPVNTSSNNYHLIYSNASVLQRLTIEHDSLTGGSIGIYLVGLSSDYNTDILIKDNKIDNWYTGMQLQYISVPVVTGNTITVKGGYALYMSHFDGKFMINSNYLMPAKTNGMYLSNGSGGTPPIGEHGQIYNNAIALNTTSNDYGIQLYFMKNTDVVYNTINIFGSATGSTGLRFSGTNSNLQLANNILSNEAGGYAVDFSATGGLTGSDYNDLYSSGNYLAKWGNRYLRNLDSLQNANNMETHSLSIYPHFPSTTNLRTDSPWLDGKGQPFAGLTVDIVDSLRDATTPDIGAYEFTSDPQNTPLSGTYDIGTGMDYTTFTGAASDLIFRGISGPVTFDVAPGTYVENFTLRSIPGSSTADTVTFRSKSGKTADVNIYYAATGTADNYLVELIGTNHLRLWNLTLTANNQSSSNYGQIVDFTGSVGDVGIKHCNLIGTPHNTSSNNLSILYGYQSNIAGLTLENDSLKQGSSSLYLIGLNQDYSTGLIVKDCYLNNYYYGIYAQYQNTPQFMHNQIGSTGSYPMYLNNISGTFMVTGNKLIAPSSGLYMNNAVGGKPPIGTHALVANNFISTYGTNANRALYLTSSSNIDFYYNSLLVGGSKNTSATVYVTGSGSENQFVNNIFANKSGGYTYDANVPSLINLSDYNDLYTTGTYIARWSGTQIAALADLQTASSMDGHSIAANPGFASNTDLHVTAVALDSVGTPLARVTTDIDGQPRDPNKPDIGADEFIAGGTPIEDPPGTVQAGTELPKKFVLYQNYPNPFNPSTQIRYGIPRASDVRIDVYNTLGQRIMTLVQGRQSAGYHIVTWNPKGAASGVYFYRIQAGSYVKIMKMLFIK